MARRIRRREAPKRSTRIRRVKIPLLVVSAVKNLRNSNGSTPTRILNYVAKVSDISKSAAKSRVEAALKRGVNCGVLKRERGRYLLDVDASLINSAKYQTVSSSPRRNKRKRRRESTQRESTSLKKSRKTVNRRRVEPFSMVVRKPLLSVRKRPKKARTQSSPHQLSDMYCNPSYKASTDSSIASSLSRKSSDQLQRMSSNVSHQDEDL